MMNLYRHEFIVSAAGRYMVLDKKGAIKKLEWHCGGTAGSVRVFDQSGPDVTETRPLAMLSAVANSADRISYDTNECLSIETALVIRATQAGTFAAYYTRNPTGP